MEFLSYKQKYVSAHEFLTKLNLPKADEVLTELQKKFLDYGEYQRQSKNKQLSPEEQKKLRKAEDELTRILH